MQMEPNEFGTLLDRICSEPTLRRQFLWLRAQEKGDIATVRDLEAVDPALSSRMAALVREFVARGNHLATSEDRRRGFGRMYDELFEQLRETLE
jgi:hypothetical protein